MQAKAEIISSAGSAWRQNVASTDNFVAQAGPLRKQLLLVPSRQHHFRGQCNPRQNAIKTEIDFF
jgi:hypothetical protein